VDSSRPLKPSEIRAQQESTNYAPKPAHPPKPFHTATKPSEFQRSAGNVNESTDVQPASNGNGFKGKSPPLPRAKFNQEVGNLNEKKSPPKPHPPFRKPDTFQEKVEVAPPLPGRPATLPRDRQVDTGPSLPSRPAMPPRPAAREDNNRPPQHSGISIS
jgi:hypothetical protein